MQPAFRAGVRSANAPLLTQRVLLVPERPHVPPRSVAAFATGKQDNEKSWGDIAAEAADVAKSVFDKVKSGASAAIEAFKPPKTPLEQPRDEDRSRGPLKGRQGGDAPLAPLFGDGLLARAVGGMVAGALRGLGEQLEKQARETRGVYEDAAVAIRGCPEVAARLGGAVSVGGPMSQSSSSSNINGRVTKRVVMVLPVSGPNGAFAQAQVISTETSGAPAATDIKVVMPTGESIQVSGGSGGSGGGRKRYVQTGEVIDAEYTDVKS